MSIQIWSRTITFTDCVDKSFFVCRDNLSSRPHYKLITKTSIDILQLDRIKEHNAIKKWHYFCHCCQTIKIKSNLIYSHFFARREKLTKRNHQFNGEIDLASSATTTIPELIPLNTFSPISIYI